MHEFAKALIEQSVEYQLDMSNSLDELLNQPLVVVNVGLESFSEELTEQDIDVIQVDWKPPAGGDTELADLLSRLGG